MGNFTLKQRFPCLYNIVRKKGASVSLVFSSVPLNISFRRGLVGQNLVAWHRLVASLVHIQLNESKDVFRWDLHQNKIFLVRSMYDVLN